MEGFPFTNSYVQDHEDRATEAMLTRIWRAVRTRGYIPTGHTSERHIVQSIVGRISSVRHDTDGNADHVKVQYMGLILFKGEGLEVGIEFHRISVDSTNGQHVFRCIAVKVFPNGYSLISMVPDTSSLRLIASSGDTMLRMSCVVDPDIVFMCDPLCTLLLSMISKNRPPIGKLPVDLFKLLYTFLDYHVA